jgi:hypothetical protein
MIKKLFFFSNSLPQGEAKEEEVEVEKGLPFCAYELSN